MVGTITTRSYCVVAYGIAVEGSKADIVAELAPYTLNNRVLSVQFRGYERRTYHSYSDEYSEQEMHSDVVKFLFSKLPELGFRVYRDIGF